MIKKEDQPKVLPDNTLVQWNRETASSGDTLHQAWTDKHKLGVTALITASATIDSEVWYEITTVSRPPDVRYFSATSLGEFFDVLRLPDEESADA